MQISTNNILLQRFLFVNEKTHRFTLMYNNCKHLKIYLKSFVFSDKITEIKLNKCRLSRHFKEGFTLTDSEKNENIGNPQEIEEANAQPEEAEASVAGETADELGEELEGIRSKFQEILDEETQTYLAGGDIQAYDDAEEEPESEEPISEDMLCRCCGERKRNTQSDEDYPYCDECTELMKHSPFSFSGILALVAVLVLTGVSIFYVFASSADIIDKAHAADTYYQSGKIYTALNTYGEVLQGFISNNSDFGKMPVPRKIVRNYADICAEMTEYGNSKGVAEQFFSESDFKNPAYKKLTVYSEKYDFMSKVSETIQQALTMDKNGADEICETIEGLRGTEGCDDFLLDNYKLSIQQYFGADNEKQYEILSEMKKSYPDKWIVDYALCAVCSKLGKTEEALSSYEEVIRHNTEDGSVYVYLADTYRFSEECDPDKIIEAVEAGIEAEGEGQYSFTDLSREKAVALLLKGDYDAAYDAMAEAYQVLYSMLYSGQQPVNLAQFFYTYQLCAHLKGDRDVYDSSAAMLGMLGYEESKDLKSFINEKTTLENILTDKEGDLA